MKNKEVTFIIVLYKSEKIIEECLSYLENFNKIILDNSNNIDLKEKILKNYNNIIEYIIPKKNLGYSAGNNLAAKFIKSKYIYFINPDIFFIEKDLDILINEFEKDPLLGLISPSLIDKNNNLLNNKMKFPENRNKKEILIHNKIDWIWGASMMIKKKIFDECDGFDEKFFMYNSDVDLCKKIHLMGYKIRECTDLKIMHLGAKSSDLKFFENCKLKISHKLSLYQYLKKYNLLTKTKLLVDFIDFFQRMIFNLIQLKLKKSFTNFLRIIAIIIFLSY